MKNAFYNAKWIGKADTSDHNKALYLACSFNLEKKKYKKFTLLVSGLGLFEASVNGKKVSDTFFDPGESNYGKRVYYVKYDITDMVSEGENALGIILGNGQYTNFIIAPTMEKDGELIFPNRYQKNDGGVFQKGIYGIKKAIALIEADGEPILVTDENWKVTYGAITFQSWYGGEDYDSLKEIENWDKPHCDRSCWKNASVLENIGGELTERDFNPVRIIEEFKAVSIIKNADSYIADFGKNGAGFVKLRLNTTPAMRGVRIKILPCEELDENLFADQRSSTQSWSETKKCEISDSYVIKGTGFEEWHPRFCYHGFRYIEVRGFPYEPKADNFIYCRLRADNKKCGSFETDNVILKKINDMTDRSVESNMFFAFTDCPQIEKLGWLETSHLMFKSMAYGWDIRKWIPKIVTDMADSSADDGYMPAIVPEFHRINGLCRDVNWGGACIMTPWYYYEFYNDKKILEKSVTAGEKYISHLGGFVKNGLIEGYSQMGDWGQINEDTPKILVENSAYYLCLVTLAKSFDVLGMKEKAEKYFSLAEGVKRAFHENSTCYDKAKRIYGNGSQSSYGCVLFSHIAADENTEDAVKKLAEAVKRANFHLTSGEVGLKQVFAALNKYGYDSLVYKMVTNPTPPGYGYFAEKNLTTLPEYWNYEEPWWGMVRSRNHAMMGHVKEWLIHGVLGVRYENMDDITIKPFVPPDASYAKGSFLCGKGEIKIFWQVSEENKIRIDVNAPRDVKIQIIPPDGYVIK